MDAATVVRSLFAAVASRDVDAARALVDDDAEFWPEGTAEYVGRRKPYRGPGGVQEYFDDLRFARVVASVAAAERVLGQ